MEKGLSMKKKILIHSIAFNPDGVSTGYLYSDIATALRDAGNEVVVLTTTPHFNKVDAQLKAQPLKWKIWGLLKKSDYKGIKVYHVPQKKFKSTLLRLIGFVYWHLVSFFSALFIKKIDVIISPSPPLTIGMVNLWLGKIKGAKVIYNVQEVYPDILGKKSGLVYRVLSKLERTIYNQSDAITTIDKIFYNNIVGRFKNKDKLHIIPNFVDTSIYRPVQKGSNLNEALFVDNDHLKLLYAGNIGMAQEWNTLIELAKKTKGMPIDYYVIGEGVMHKYVADKIAEFSLENVFLLPYQPRECMPDILAFSDIQFIFMEPQIAAQGFPSKVYTIMASAKPLLVCSPENSPIVNFLDKKECAKIVTVSEVNRKVEEIYAWLMAITPEELNRMGANGLVEIERNYSKEKVTKQYCDLVDAL